MKEILNNRKTVNEAPQPPLQVGGVMCCFNCVCLGVKPKSGKYWCVNDKSYLSGWVTQPHSTKCNLHVLEK